MRRLARVEPFLASSSSQVMGYCRLKGYKVPKHRKTKQDTVNEEALREIIRHHPEDEVLDSVLEYRAIQKAKGYLADTYMGKDYRYHPIFTFHPNSGRLAAKSPNTMNQPKGRSDYKAKLAEAVRSTIVAPPGWLLLEPDWKAIEALLVGYFAEDPAYMRAARLGVHGILASHILGEPISLALPDADILRRVNALKRAHPHVYSEAKVAIHASNYLEGIFNMARDLRCEVSLAKKYRAIYYKMAPLVQKWQDSICKRAHKDHFLMNPFGYVSPYYFAVWAKNKYTGEWEPGKQASEVASFLPQSTAAAMLRETLLSLSEVEEEEKWYLLTPVHDSLLVCTRKEELAETATILKGLMTKEWKELGGLSVEVEMKVGESWNEREMSSYATR